MSRIVIKPKDEAEASLIRAILQKMNIKAQDLTDEALEEYVIAQEAREGSKTNRVSEQEIQDYLKGQNED